MDHKQLVEIGYKWCKSRCGFVLKELACANSSGEIPDVIGFNSSGTFLLEAKTSRSDFFADKKKVFRFLLPENGMGDWRFYITPKGLLKVDELPEGWGLIEVNEKGKPRIRHNPFGKGNVYSGWIRNPKSIRSEWSLMYSALRRLEVRNRIEEIYDNNY